jgi:hypothetical protein
MPRRHRRSRRFALGACAALLSCALPGAAASAGIRVTAQRASKLAGDDATTSNQCDTPLQGDVCMIFSFDGGAIGPGANAREVAVTDAVIQQQTGYANCVIRDLNPAVNIFHPSVGKLDVAIARAGEARHLYGPAASGCGNTLNTRFDDDGAALANACPPQPILRGDQALSTLDGTRVDTTWRLDVDNSTADDGSIQSWGFAADLDCQTAPDPPPPSECVPSPTTLCLNDNRFEVTASWRTNQNQSGQGFGVRLTAETGYFWFFDPNNVEVVVKVLDACADPFHRFWVFSSGMTNVEVTLLVTDTETHDSKMYINELDHTYKAVTDTDAFDSCP